MPNTYAGWRVHITVEDGDLFDLNTWLLSPFNNGDPPPADEFFGKTYPVVPLSATGLDPATHWAGTGWISEGRQLSWFSQTSEPATCAYAVQNMNAPVNPGNPDFDLFLSAQGLQIIPDSVSVPTPESAPTVASLQAFPLILLQILLTWLGVPWSPAMNKNALIALFLANWPPP